MWFHRNGSNSRPGTAPAKPGDGASTASTTKQRGDVAEDIALEHLQRHGLRLLQRNFKTPGRGGGEVDLIMRDTDGTLVFVEVRQRASGRQGGAGASITPVKQRRVVLAARHFLAQLGSEPACRFDVVLMEGREPPLNIEWHRAAFDAPATF